MKFQVAKYSLILVLVCLVSVTSLQIAASIILGKDDVIMKEDKYTIEVKQYSINLKWENDHMSIYTDSAIVKFRNTTTVVEGKLLSYRHNLGDPPHTLTVYDEKQKKKITTEEGLLSCSDMGGITDEHIGKKIRVEKVFYPREEIIIKVFK